MSVVCVKPGCKCPTSLRQEREAAAVALPASVAAVQPVEQPEPAEPVKRAPGRPLEPCGTVAAYRRHGRRGEPIDEACREAQNRVKRDREAAQRAAEIAATAPMVTVGDGVVTIVASMDDARAIAAAALDRAMVLEKVAGSTAQAVGQRRGGEMLRALHKQIATIARAAA